MEKKGCTGIVLAAGQGRRMGTKVQKQYLELDGKPVLYYALHAFERSKYIDDIILVVGQGQESFCRSESDRCDTRRKRTIRVCVSGVEIYGRTKKCGWSIDRRNCVYS